ncbi:FtsK/SpoIIIE domain-containing protein [Euzebya pacifica]|uniref:FtsK/SpoIIIE domain-containing protein n=1 Tax=Euzebya pacifica TaxID=1608957 RepID=UPI0030FD02C5
MSAHDEEVVRQVVRGHDGRWTMADVTGSEDVDQPPQNRSGPAPGRTSTSTPDNGTPDTSPPDTSPPDTSPSDTGPLDTGPMVRRLLVRAGGTDRHVVVLGDSGQSTDQLVEELQRIVPGTPLIDGAPLPRGAMVESLGLHDGQVVTVEADDHQPAGPATGPVLRIVGGPDAGRTVPVRMGQMTIGRAAGNSIVLADPNASRSHCVVHRDDDGIVVIDVGSANGTRVEGVPEPQARLQPGDLLRLGDSLLELGDADDVETVVLEQGHDALGVHRRFRAGVDDPPNRIRYPQKRDPGEPQPLNLLMAILPAGGIAVMAFLFGRPEMLIFAAMSPMLAIGRNISAKRNHRDKVLQSEVDHREAVARFSTEFGVMRAAERRHRRHAVPDPARIVEAATRPTTELWNRRCTDADALTVRVGSAFAPSNIEVEGAPERDADDPQPWLPVGVSLVEFGGLALVGDLPRVRALARSLVLQAAVLHASELRIVFLGGHDAAGDWTWLRWLPHVRRGPLEPSLLLGTDASSRAARVEELRRILTERREAAEDRRSVFAPRILLVCDDASARLGEGVAELVRDGGPLGIHALCLDTLQVPEGCDASVVLGERVDGARVERRGQPPVRGVITDALDAGRCEEVSRALAPVRVIGEEDDDGLPTSCRLLSTLGLQPTATHVRARWRAVSPSSRATIGVGPERPIALDLTRDGPHALVAGTTGAGKSEFIKTFVASLALENHPDHLSFLFIDFKGGGDYRTLVRLPHAVALATNLDDPAAFDRTLALLEAEMGRRVGLLQAAGTTSIEGYMAVPGGPPTPMPRLVVVADEFAELKDKAPQQLDRLVSVARTGRSVGVHLLLATQRPGGVVTSQIDANVGLRVCFRVTDEQESKEVIGSPLAGRIAERHRGRAVFRSAATPLTEVQTARVAGARPGAVSAAPVRAVELDWERLGRPFPKGPETGEVPDADTDLHDVVEALRQAATDEGWTHSAIPWPPELPDQLPVSALPLDEANLADAIPVGLVDVPSTQRQEVQHIRLGGGHVVIAGSARTGRSTALRTFLTGVVQRFGPADLRIAALDFGGGALLPVQQLPHCTGLSMEDLVEAEGIVASLERELARRRDLFAEHGWPDLPAQRAQSDTPLPWLLLAIEGWDNLAEEGMRQSLHTRVAQLLARGTPQGLQVVMTGDRGTTHSMIARHLTHRYSLRFNRSVDAELQGIMARDLPRYQPPGRAVEIRTTRLLQFAELDDPDRVGQAVAFQRALAEVVAAGGSDAEPRRGLGTEPTSTVPDAMDMASTGPPAGTTFPLLLGMGEDPRAPVWADLEDSGGLFFVVGPPGTGRSTTLHAMAVAAHHIGIDVAVAGPDTSPLATDPTVPGQRVSLADHERLVPRAGRRLLVLIDDLDLLEDSRALQQTLGSSLPGRGVVVTADITWMKARFSGLAAAVRRPRRGVILSPLSTANGVEMFATSLDPALIAPPDPGRAVANLGGGHVLLRVPEPPGESSGTGEELGGVDR